MNWRVAIRVFALVALCFPATALAASKPAAPQRFETEIEKTLPPIGFVRFCVKNPEECRNALRRPSPITISVDSWDKLFAINTMVNSKIRPVSDQELYGEPEVWTYPTTAGDCEDFLLLKKRYLEALGFPPQSLLITVVLDEKSEGHAVLTAVTTQGDFILDNRRDDILRWEKTGYRFLKRQSQINARQWASLARKSIAAGEQVSSQNTK